MHWNEYIDNLFYILIVILACFFTNEFNMFIKMITIDSLFCAFHFFKTFINNNIPESQIITQSSQLYNGSLLDRYIIYSLYFAFYKLFCNIIWISDFNILYYTIFVHLIPSLLNKMINSLLFNYFRLQKENIIKLLISKNFAYVINFFSRLYLNKDMNIKHKELLPLFDNYKETINNFLEFVKNGLVLFLLIYIKSYSPNFYYKVIKYFYNYKTGNMLVSFNVDSAKYLLTNLISSKKWDELSNPNTLRAIFYLYQMNEEKTDLLKNLIINFNYNLGKMFSIWTISSFFNFVLLSPILSFFIIIYKNVNNLVTKKHQLVSLLLASIIGFYSDNFFLTSFFCQFGDLIFFNKVTFNIMKFLIKKTKKLSGKIYKKNQNIILPLVSIFLNVYVFSTIREVYPLILFFLNVMYICLINNGILFGLIASIFIIIGSLSDFNFFHMVFNLLLIYLLLGSNIDFDNVINTIKKNIILNRIYLNDYIDKIKLKLKIKKYIKWIKKRKSDNSFEIMDIDKFPSVSKFDKQLKNYDVKNLEKDNEINKKINNQKIIKIYDKNQLENSEIIQDIFSLSKDEFIDFISVDENKDKVSQEEKNFEIKKKNSLNVIENFVK